MTRQQLRRQHLVGIEGGVADLDAGLALEVGDRVGSDVARPSVDVERLLGGRRLVGPAAGEEGAVAKSEAGRMRISNDVLKIRYSAAAGSLPARISRLSWCRYLHGDRRGHEGSRLRAPPTLAPNPPPAPDLPTRRHTASITARSWGLCPARLNWANARRACAMLPSICSASPRYTYASSKWAMDPSVGASNRVHSLLIIFTCLI